MPNRSTTAFPTRFGFLLLDDFTLISLSSAIEPLCLANRISQVDHSRRLILSVSGGPVTASAEPQPRTGNG